MMQQPNSGCSLPKNTHKFDHCGRGIVTLEPLQGDDAQLPLVLVPESLYLTASAADGLLSPALQDADRPPLRDSLNAGLSVAALLAHQR